MEVNGHNRVFRGPDHFVLLGHGYFCFLKFKKCLSFYLSSKSFTVSLSNSRIPVVTGNSRNYACHTDAACKCASDNKSTNRAEIFAVKPGSEYF